MSKKIASEQEVKEEEEKKEICLDIPSPPPEIIKPKIRTITKPSRPCTPIISQAIENKPMITSSGKVSRRLRSFVTDHRDTPM
jgi:hypothetical protein